MESLGLALGAAGIVIGIIIAYRQDKQTARIDTIISNTGTMISQTQDRENKMKSEILRRVRFNTNDIRTIFVTTQRLIDRYRREPIKENWQYVTKYVTNDDRDLIKRTEELGTAIIADLGLIVLLINNPLLVTKFWDRYVHLSIFELKRLLAIGDPEDVQRRQELQDSINRQIESLNEALTLIDREMPQ